MVRCIVSSGSALTALRSRLYSPRVTRAAAAAYRFPTRLLRYRSCLRLLKLTHLKQGRPLPFFSAHYATLLFTFMRLQHVVDYA